MTQAIMRPGSGNQGAFIKNSRPVQAQHPRAFGTELTNLARAAASRDQSQRNEADVRMIDQTYRTHVHPARQGQSQSVNSSMMADESNTSGTDLNKMMNPSAILRNN